MLENKKTRFIEVPYQKLEKEALVGLVEEYISREGSDYGLLEYSFTQKKEQVLSELKAGRAKIFFDPKSQSTQVLADY